MYGIILAVRLAKQRDLPGQEIAIFTHDQQLSVGLTQLEKDGPEELSCICKELWNIASLTESASERHSYVNQSGTCQQSGGKMAGVQGSEGSHHLQRSNRRKCEASSSGPGALRIGDLVHTPILLLTIWVENTSANHSWCAGYV
jgi:hypothetical protein